MILSTLVTLQLHFEMCAGLYGHPAYFGSSFSACCPTAKGGCAGVGGGQTNKKNKADRTYLTSKKVLSSFVSCYVDQSFTAKFVQADVLVTTHRQRESKEYQPWIYSPVNLWIMSI